MSVVEAFREALAAAGLPTTDPLHPDARLRRFRVGADPDKTGWYVLHSDPPPSAAYGCWRRGIKATWRGARDVADWHGFVADRHDRDGARRRDAAQAAERATVLWRTLPPAAPDHPYLVRKRIAAGDLRQAGACLAIPVWHLEGSTKTLCSIEFVDPGGGKRFLRGSCVTAGFCPVGAPTSTVLLAEGYATAATLHQATGLRAIAAFSAGNLLPVAQALAGLGLDLVVCGDADVTGVGQTAAEGAAAAVGARCLICPAPGQDFNDLGVEAVCSIFATIRSTS